MPQQGVIRAIHVHAPRGTARVVKNRCGGFVVVWAVLDGHIQAFLNKVFQRYP